METESARPKEDKRRPVGCLVVLLCILFGMVAYAIYEIETRRSGEVEPSEPGVSPAETAPEGSYSHTPRDEREAEKARQRGTLRDGE